jgi:hypothetical protein
MVKELIEIATAAAEAKIGATAKKLAKDLLALLDQPEPTVAWAPTTDAGSVHVPREANRYYRPAEARAFAVAVLRAADKAEGYQAKRIDRVDEVPRH